MLLLVVCQGVGAGVAGAGDPVSEEFFERKIRPLLAEECRECHARDTEAKGGLLLDELASLLRGGDSGPAIRPGDAEGSLLWQAVAYRRDDLKMPRNKPRLPDAAVEDLRRWIDAGAPWPERAEVDAEEGVWEAAFERRKDWWSLRPLSPPAGGQGDAGGAGWHPVDRPIREAWEGRGLEPAARADARSLLRRLSYVLTGLPPTRAERDRFLAGGGEGWWDDAVDYYLAQPGFGEAWARHWMDWVRYAESHGSEGDPAIPHAWRYRDYLVRALNDDVPWDRLIEEHVAGDLLPDPRRLPDGTNESALGVAQLRMVQHGFTPTDAHDEFITFTDNQVDVVTKAFLGLTVSCARCHNHKFDAISQEDYQALFGIFAGARPALVNLAPRDDEATVRAAARAADELRVAVARRWRAEIDETMEALRGWDPDGDEVRRCETYHHPLAGWLVSRGGELEGAARAWEELAGRWQQVLDENRAGREGAAFSWQAGEGGFWSVDGLGLDGEGRRSGGIIPSTRDEVLVEAIVPPGIVAGAFGDHLRGVAMSGDFVASAGGELHVSVAGGGGARGRYVVWHYPRSGLIYPKVTLGDGRARWQTWNVDYWKGERIYWEFATAPDAPVEAGAPGGRSWFVITGVRHGGPRPQEEGGPVWGLPGGRVSPREAVADREGVYRAVLGSALAALEADDLSAGQAEFLQELFVRGWLSNRPAGGTVAAHQVWREAAAQLAVPVRAPGVWETAGADHVLYERGDHRKPLAPVPRRFLSAIDPVSCQDGTGRLQLARALVAESNPVTPRVMVNRVWHHVFGRGLAATPDNLGRLGSEPTHPALLDELAWRFREEHRWSIKSLLRLLLGSEAFRRSTVPPAGMADRDPAGEWLAWYPLRRLPAEAVRDSLLASSGLLDPGRGGPPAARDAPRRSIYLPVVRNSPVPFLATFDAPAPFATVGARESSNVPAQALALMNDPFVERCASRVAVEVAGEGGGAEEIVEGLYERILGRPPGDRERERAIAWVGSLREGSDELRQREAVLVEELAAIGQELAAFAARVVPDRGEGEGEPGRGGGPEADLEWDFVSGEGEVEGRVETRLMGGAKVEGGALHTGADAWLEAGPLPFGLKEKTFEAWVSLADTDQGGGGVLAVETRSPHAFDALVYGERQPGVWMAGSEFFRRTRDMEGVVEKPEGSRAVHLALVYEADGTTRLYRNGREYGRAFRVEGAPVAWEAGQAVLLMGRRHSPPGNKLGLEARIHRVRLYARALGEEEIRASLARHPTPPSEAEWIEGLPDELRRRARELVDGRERRERELAELSGEVREMTEQQGWERLAHALYNMKEFLYIP